MWLQINNFFVPARSAGQEGVLLAWNDAACGLCAACTRGEKPLLGVHAGEAAAAQASSESSEEGEQAGGAAEQQQQQRRRKGRQRTSDASHGSAARAPEGGAAPAAAPPGELPGEGELPDYLVWRQLCIALTHKE